MNATMAEMVATGTEVMSIHIKGELNWPEAVVLLGFMALSGLVMFMFFRSMP